MHALLVAQRGMRMFVVLGGLEDRGSFLGFNFFAVDRNMHHIDTSSGLSSVAAQAAHRFGNGIEAVVALGHLVEAMFAGFRTKILHRGTVRAPPAPLRSMPWECRWVRPC